MVAIASFPVEILEAIASELSQCDLSAFTRTNRHLYLVLTQRLYHYNKERHGSSALAWGVRHGLIRTAQYAIQQNCDFEARYEPKGDARFLNDQYNRLTPLSIAIWKGDYAMTRLLVESGAEIHDRDIFRASASCQQVIQDLIYDYCVSLGRGPDEPISKAFRAVMQMGHDELVDLVSRKDRMNIPSLFSPIWPSLVEAVRTCEANISIFGLILDAVAGIADEKKRQYLWSQCSGSPFRCCDMTLKLFWEKEKSLTGHTSPVNTAIVRRAAVLGNKSLLSTCIEMGVDINCFDYFGVTPIMHAACHGRFKAFEFLLEKGADPHRKLDSFMTTMLEAQTNEGPFLWCDMEGKKKIVDYLLEQEAREIHG